MTFCLR